MKLKRFRYLIIVVFAVLVMFSKPNCNVADEDLYKLTISSFNDSFIGYYTLDSTRYVIPTSEIFYENGIYTYEKPLGSLTTLDVRVAGVSGNTSFLTVDLYKDDVNVGFREGTAGDANHFSTVSFSYTASDSRD